MHILWSYSQRAHTINGDSILQVAMWDSDFVLFLTLISPDLRNAYMNCLPCFHFWPSPIFCLDIATHQSPTNCCFCFWPCPTTMFSISFLVILVFLETISHYVPMLTSNWLAQLSLEVVNCLELPGFWNHRHGLPYPVTMSFRFVCLVLIVSCFILFFETESQPVVQCSVSASLRPLPPGLPGCDGLHGPWSVGQNKPFLP